MVIPRSRSMSIRSRYCARIARSSTTPVIWSIRSARVDLPWSMWAMMQKFRICSGGVAAGCSAVRARGDTGARNLTDLGNGQLRPSSHARADAGDGPVLTHPSGGRDSVLVGVFRAAEGDPGVRSGERSDSVRGVDLRHLPGAP